VRDGLGQPSPSGWSAPRRPRADVGSRFQVGRGTLALTLSALVLGILLVAQFQTELPKPAESDTRPGLAASTIQRLEQEQADLKKTIKDSRERLGVLGRNATAGAAHLADLTQALERQKLLAGVVPLKGRGLRVVLDDSATTKIPADADLSNYIIHEYQLRDVLNLLWQSGAEAVSLNGERIVATTSIYCVGSTILVNNTRLSPPYEFLAIGEPAALEAALNTPSNLKALKARVKSFGIQLSVSRQAALVVPAYTGSFEVKHAIPPATGTDNQSAGQNP
jgi:uncharacterized protein YlxW (UPF0749 family)